jgi:hypothetical protein
LGVWKDFAAVCIDELGRGHVYSKTVRELCKVEMAKHAGFWISKDNYNTESLWRKKQYIVDLVGQVELTPLGRSVGLGFVHGLQV